MGFFYRHDALCPGIVWPKTVIDDLKSYSLALTEKGKVAISSKYESIS